MKSPRDPESFFLDTVILINSRNIIPMVYPYQVIRKVNDWCNNSKISIWNRNKVTQQK